MNETQPKTETESKPAEPAKPFVPRNRHERRAVASATRKVVRKLVKRAQWWAK